METPGCTERLRLVPFTADFVRSALMDRTKLAADVGARIPDTWPNAELADVLPYFLEALDAEPVLADWIALAIERTEGVLVGSAGFIGLPGDEGTVEIGFAIEPAYQRRGYGRELVAAMIARAFRDSSVRGVNARCLPDNKASVRLLQSQGFTLAGTDEGLLCWWLAK